MIRRAFNSIKARFIAVFLLLTLLPLLLAFFFSANVLIEIIERAQRRNLTKLGERYSFDLTHYPKSKLIAEILSGDDELKIKLFLNMRNQVYGKIKTVFIENDITAIGIVNASKSINIYLNKPGEYLDEVDDTFYQTALAGAISSGIKNIRGVYYAYYLSPIKDKQTDYITGAVLICFKIDDHLLERMLIDENSAIIFFDIKRNKTAAITGKFKDYANLNLYRDFYLQNKRVIGDFYVLFSKPDASGDYIIATAMDRTENRYIIWLIIRRFIVIGFVLILGGIMFGIYNAHKIIEPIKALTNAINDSIAREELAPVKLKYSGKDEAFELAELFNKMVAKLRETQEHLMRSSKLASIGQLTAGISHEINNPLVTILGYAQLMLEKIDKDREPKLYKYLKIIEDDSRRCKNTISNLLSFARAAEDKIEPVNLKTVAEDIIALFELECQKNNISILFENFAAIPLVYGDVNRLKQVFINLILNSIYSLKSDKKPEKTIKIKFSESIDELSVEVFDNGCGIKSEDIDRIFDPYFTTKKTGEGTGLGLSISYGILKLYKAKITVESEYGKYARFTIKWQKPKTANQEV